MLALLLISFTLNFLTSEFFTYKWAGYTFDIYSAVTFGTLALFFALIKLKFFRRKIIRTKISGHDNWVSKIDKLLKI